MAYGAMSTTSRVSKPCLGPGVCQSRVELAESGTQLSRVRLSSIIFILFYFILEEGEGGKIGGRWEIGGRGDGFWMQWRSSSGIWGGEMGFWLLGDGFFFYWRRNLFCFNGIGDYRIMNEEMEFRVWGFRERERVLEWWEEKDREGIWLSPRVDSTRTRLSFETLTTTPDATIFSLPVEWLRLMMGSILLVDCMKYVNSRLM